MSSYQVRARSGTPIADDFDSDIPPLVEDFDTGRTFSVTEAGVITLIGPMNQAEIGFILYPQTAAELVAGVTPTNYAYAPGQIYRYGDNTVPGTTDMTTAFANAILANYGNTIELPAATILVSNLTPWNGAGTKIHGASKYGTIIKVKAGTTGSVFGFTSAASSTSAYNAVENLSFDLNAQNVIAVDYSSVNNSAVRDCYIKGGTSIGTATGTGIKFDAPTGGGAFSNRVQNCSLQYLATGVLYGVGANKNSVDGGECISCTMGVNAAPAGYVDTPQILNMRFEACATGLKEGATQGTYVGLRFENESVTDVEFTASSIESCWLGGTSATTATPITNLTLVGSIYAISPDLVGVWFRSSSAARPHVFTGANVFAPLADAGTVTAPPAAGAVAAYFRGGRAVLDNLQYLLGRNAAGNNVLTLIRSNAGDRVEIDAGANGIQLGGALTALGGGAAPTLGTIGGTGPATAAQNTWKLFYDNGGVPFWVPVWK